MEYQHSHCIYQAPSYLSEVLFMFCVLHHDIYHTYIIVDQEAAPHGPHQCRGASAWWCWVILTTNISSLKCLYCKKNPVIVGERSGSPGMMYFPIKWGAKEPQNLQNYRVGIIWCQRGVHAGTQRWIDSIKNQILIFQVFFLPCFYYIQFSIVRMLKVDGSGKPDEF